MSIEERRGGVSINMSVSIEERRCKYKGAVILYIFNPTFKNILAHKTPTHSQLPSYTMNYQNTKGKIRWITQTH